VGETPREFTRLTNVDNGTLLSHRRASDCMRAIPSHTQKTCFRAQVYHGVSALTSGLRCPLPAPYFSLKGIGCLTVCWRFNYIIVHNTVSIVVFTSKSRRGRRTQAMSEIPRDLAVLFTRLVDMERMATTQEWWMFGRVLPEARQLAELSSLLAAARAELAQLLSTLGYPPAVRLTHPGTSEL